jgi:hypothetical protein
VNTLQNANDTDGCSDRMVKKGEVEEASKRSNALR